MVAVIISISLSPFGKGSAIFLAIALVLLLMVKEHCIVIFECFPDYSYTKYFLCAFEIMLEMYT